jgi:hypothetical protein
MLTVISGTKIDLIFVSLSAHLNDLRSEEE